MDLRDSIVDIAPRESSGSLSSDRFQYQIDWVLSKILEAHEGVEDYVVILEHHDDAIILDSESNPKRVSFYQIKTKTTGNWTLSSLLKRKAGKNGPLLSIMGKLYSGKVNWPNDTKSLNLISNAHYDLSLRDDSSSLLRNEICAKELDDPSTLKISDQLIEEHELSSKPEFEEITFYITTDLSLSDHKVHVQGKLLDYLNHRFAGRKFHISAIYQALSDEMRRRNNRIFESGTFEELVNKKGLGRTSFENILTSLGVRVDLDDAWVSIERTLLGEGLLFKELIKIKNEWRRCELERMDRTNDAVMKQSVEVRKAVSDYSGSGTLLDLLTSILALCKTELITSGLRTEDYLKAMILMEYYEQQL